MRSLANSLLVVAMAAAACDTTHRTRDASVGAQRVSEVAVRVEVVGEGAPSVSVLAYRASASGIGTDDLLPIVDPLTQPIPDGACAFRDVAGAARALAAAGGRVELEALSGLAVDLGNGLRAFSPTPRVFPEVASMVGGVVAEAGPTELDFAPTGLALVDPVGNRVSAQFPGRVRLTTTEGDLLSTNSVVTGGGRDLVLGVSAPGELGHTAFVELRPFGATWALACPVVGRDRVVVLASEVQRLANLRVPISIEAVARDSQPVAVGGASVRLTLEVRSSAVVELRP